MLCRFVDRRDELSVLNQAYKSRPGFMIIYGRRRTGKTRLILEWIKSHKVRSVYYLSQLASHMYNMALMARVVAEQTGEPGLKGVRPERLSVLLSLLSRLNVDVIIIDEITYWVKSDPIVLSEIQEYVDRVLPNTKTLLILTGSLLGVLKDEILGGGSPLYARSTNRIMLKSLSYEYLKCFMPHYKPEDRVRLYSLVGGIPHYTCLLARTKTLKQAVQMLVNRDSPLSHEKDLLLREEFREPATYNAILSAIAKGYNTPGKIAQVTGISPGLANKALHVLEYLEFVERDIPVFRKKGVYRIRDPILRTWYGLIEPVESLVELGLEKQALNYVLSNIDTHTSQTWETLVKTYLTKKYAPKGYTRVGRLVHRNEEIDIILIHPKENKAIITEVKWSKLTPKEIAKLRFLTREKASKLLPEKYQVAKTYIAVREVEGRIPSDTITPETIDGHVNCYETMHSF
ncbi:MAG: ATP-binding protein [Desulfurococcales archaeon]|nr:ATP-binding protein [Desulfurococcales archaeon]